MLGVMEYGVGVIRRSMGSLVWLMGIVGMNFGTSQRARYRSRRYIIHPKLLETHSRVGLHSKFISYAMMREDPCSILCS